MQVRIKNKCLLLNTNRITYFLKQKECFPSTTCRCLAKYKINKQKFGQIPAQLNKKKIFIELFWNSNSISCVHNRRDSKKENSETLIIGMTRQYSNDHNFCHFINLSVSFGYFFIDHCYEWNKNKIVCIVWSTFQKNHLTNF